MEIVVRLCVSLLTVFFFLPECVPAQESNALQARQLYYKSKTDQKVDTPASEPAAKPVTPKPPIKKPPVRKKTTDEQASQDTASQDNSANEKAKEEKSTQSRQPTAGHRLQTDVSGPLGLKYSIEAADSKGRYAPVDPDKTFSTGDSIRVRMEVNADAYVYLVARGSSGEGSVLFPQRGEDNHLRAFQSVLQPAESVVPITFAEPAGTETLYIFVARTPVTDLDKLLPVRGALVAANVPAPDMGELVGHAERMQSRDLVRGKAPDIRVPSEQAVYAVNVSNSPGAQVMQKLELRHR